MLNYTSKIQHFLNLHRKHTKYIVVLLLLSAFVASFVCSALTEPAVSMTNQSFDITTNLSVDSDGATQDGLPIIDESYSSGQFSGYMNEAAPLGIATRFGLFAFESVDIIAHCNTNLATPNATIGAPFGSSQIAAEGGQEITLITDSLSIGDITSNNTVLLFPESVNFVDEQDNFVSINPLPRVKINNGETKHINQGSTKMYAYHVRKEAFINWTEEKNNYIERQNDWINKNGTADNYSIYVKAWYDENDENNKTISRIEIPNEGEYYLYIPYNKLPNGSRELNITLGKNVTLIINVDLSGAGETYDANFQITGSQGGSNFTNESSALEKGMNLLWNFYDSSDNQNNQYTGTINMVKPGVGCIVAPSANVNIDASFAGTIVANNIKTTATFSKSMFKTVVIAEETDIAVMAHKEWADGKDAHTKDSVTVQLYKSLSPNASLNDLKDSDKEGDPRILNADNNWNDTWFGLDRNYYYYVKEIEAKDSDGKVYTCNTEYENNARNTTGTVKVKNTIKTIDQNEKLRLTVKMYWSDNAALHPETEVDYGNGNKENLKRKWVDLYRTTEPKQLNELKSADTDSNNNVTNWNDQCEDLRGFFIYEKGEKQDDEFKQPWQYTTKELPVVDSNNNLYYYYVVFNHNSDGTYMFEYSNNGVSGKSDTITVGAIKMLQLTVNKNWEDDNNTSDNGEVAYKVYQSRTKADYRPSDAKEIAEIKSGSNNLSFNLNNSNNWKASIGRSPQLPQSTIYGEKYYYYVEETSISGSELNKYNISYTNNGFNDDADVTITNQKKEAGKFSIKVDKIKPNALKSASTAILYQSLNENNWDNPTEIGRMDLTESNGWKCVFTNLPMQTNDGNAYYYKLVEDKTPAGFDVSYSQQIVKGTDVQENTQKELSIYNNRKTVSLKIQKKWEGIDEKLIKHVVIKISRYKGNGTQATNLDDYIYSNNGFVMGNLSNIVNTLDDNTTPKIDGNTATYSNLSFQNDNAVHSNHTYNAWIKFDSTFKEKTIREVEISFAGVNNNNFTVQTAKHFALCGSDLSSIKGNNNIMLQQINTLSDSSPNGSKISTATFYDVNYKVNENYYFVVSSESDICNDYYVKEIKLTFNETLGAIDGAIDREQNITVNSANLNNDGTSMSDNRLNHSLVNNNSEYNGRFVTQIDTYFYGLNGKVYNQWNLYKHTLNIYAEKNNGGEVSNVQNGQSWNDEKNIFTKKYDNVAQGTGDGEISGIAIQTRYPENLEKIVITYSDNSKLTLKNTKWNDGQNQKNICIPEIEAKVWEDSINLLENNYPEFKDCYISSISVYFHNLDDEYKDSSYKTKVEENVFNFWARNDNNGDYYPDNGTVSWNGDVLTKNYNQYVDNRRATGFSIMTYYPQNLEKIVVNYSNNKSLTITNLSHNSSNYATISLSENEETEPTYIERLIEHSFGQYNASYEPSWYYDGYSNKNGYELFKDMQLQKAIIHYANSTKLESNATNFVNSIFDVEVYSEGNEITQSNLWFEGDNLVKQYDGQTKINRINLNPCNNIQNFKMVELIFDKGKLTIKNNSYDENNLAGSTPQQPSAVTYTTTIHVQNAPFITETTSEKYGMMNTDTQYIYKLDFSSINEAFKTKKIKNIIVYFDDYDSLNREGTQPYQSVLDFYFLAKATDPNDNQTKDYVYIDADWDVGQSGYNNNDKKYTKYYSNKNYEYINEFQLITAYTKNLKEITITFHDDDSKIILTNGNYDYEGRAQKPSSLQKTPEHVKYDYPFVDGEELIISDDETQERHIPKSFKDKNVVSMSAYFENLDTFDLNDKSILDIWVSNTQDWKDFSDKLQILEEDNVRTENYKESSLAKTIQQIGIITHKHHQNFKYAVVLFDDGSTITINNSNYYEKINGTPAEGSTIPSTDVFEETIILTIDNRESENLWSKTIEGLYMVDVDGTFFSYYIQEVEIKYEDGNILSGYTDILTEYEVTNGYIETMLSDSDNGILITNKKKTTNTTMPSTGGIGTHPYRNAGILMMICSGGIYISLRALRKKQN